MIILSNHKLHGLTMNFFSFQWSLKRHNKIQLSGYFVPLFITIQYLVRWSVVLAAAGTRHSKRTLFILPWFLKTPISISYEANGTRDFRHRAGSHHLCSIPWFEYRVWSILSAGIEIMIEWQKRKWSKGVDIRPPTPLAPVYIRPSLKPLFFAAHSLISLDGDGWKCEQKWAQ